MKAKMKLKQKNQVVHYNWWKILEKDKAKLLWWKNFNSKKNNFSLMNLSFLLMIMMKKNEYIRDTKSN